MKCLKFERAQNSERSANGSLSSLDASTQYTMLVHSTVQNPYESLSTCSREREREHIKLICRTQCRGGVHSSTKKRIALHCGFRCARSSSRSKVQLNGEWVSSGMQATIVPRYCACLTQSLFRLCASCKVSSDPERFE